MQSQPKNIRIHTLGPEGTNCEQAARHWFQLHGHPHGDVVLHPTLEDAVPAVLDAPKESLLLGCVVYPRLNEIVFQNLDALVLRECFVMPTYNMVLAASSPEPIKTVYSHPAPVNLVDGRGYTVTLSNSNSAAAQACAKGLSDACITTSVAAEANGLQVVEDFGPVPMGFSIHAPHQSRI